VRRPAPNIALDVLSDMLRHSKFETDEIESRRA
jgi:hypothetical protein